MDIGPEYDSPSAPAAPVYFCSTCGKPFDQETSHLRHVQYCLRRAARKKPARQQACHFCRSSKSKCDFRSPCSRCFAKDKVCSYGRRDTLTSTATRRNVAITTGWPSESSQSTPSPLSAILRDVPVSIPNLDFDGGQVLATQPSGSLNNTFSDSIRFDESVCFGFDTPTSTAFAEVGKYPAVDIFPESALGGSDPILQAHTETDPLQFIDADSYEASPDGLVASFAPLTCSLAANREHLYSLVPSPSYTIQSQEKPSSRLISNGCRRFLVSILRTYPRMMTQPDNLPPFVHPLGCRLHYDEEEIRPVKSVSFNSTDFVPLKPLVACHGIAHIFVSRNTHSDDFLWRTIDSEQCRIMDDIQTLSRGEILAAIQSIVIYTIIRLIGSGREYFTTNRGMLRNMKKLAERFTQLFPGPLSPTHERDSRPTWEDWIFEESRRRLSITCFLMALVVGTEGSDDIANPFCLPLPGSKVLWEARSDWAWEKEYGMSWKNSKPDRSRLDTVGDLAIAHMQRGGGTDPTMGGGLNGATDEILDTWHAGLDGLGMMLAAVIADV
ncbi:hypothetical protein B0J13DRAFT_554955 [Dactylonectria estremocensis]|uniref:Zn(2)-C6 fungal-type domain-containing protein n=1 Tax=Dactylonectria estremocensis TaxID=1079267 RepID=A0A9P9ESV6_9HYPO|nr:hypothetical protein B0J13DRAFT_554955 [Dactylonectria estremocensis]